MTLGFENTSNGVAVWKQNGGHQQSTNFGGDMHCALCTSANSKFLNTHLESNLSRRHAVSFPDSLCTQLNNAMKDGIHYAIMLM